MLHSRFSYYTKRLWHIGFFTASMLCYYRLKKACFKHKWQHKKKDFAPLTKDAQEAITATILGFGSHTFSSTTTIDWHNDFFTTNSPVSWATSFFADITIPSNNQLDLTDDRLPDIKVPWELSRLHCLHDQPLERVLAILSSWMINNPFPYGVNWFNPMEVGIRAINIIVALQKHTGDPALTPAIMTQLKELLAYHAYFIEHCWEVSATPNNHYLADLVGYLHLCCFLDITKYYRKRHRAWRWVQKAFKQQLLPDGTCYEGSTAYHRLVTELFDVALNCAEEYKLCINQELYQIQKQMHVFIADCTDQAGNLILIGDNDSGTICPITSRHKKSVFTHGYSTTGWQNKYPDFGLSIMRNERCLITLRHATLAPQQPSGHFHLDENALTLNVDDVPVFIDPGTYLYTAQPAWRNALRSASAHTTVASAEYTSVPMNLDLFQLPKTAKRHAQIHRQCTLTMNDLIVKDTIISTVTTTIHWYWHLGPTIEIKAINEYTWLLLHQQKALVQLHGPLTWAIQQSRASTLYGAYKPTTILHCSAQAQQSNKMLQKFRIVFMG